MPQLNNRLTISVVKAMAVYATDQAENSSDIDLGDYNSCAISFVFGTLTDGSYVPSLEESDDGGSTWTAVAAADIQGTLTTVALTDDDTIQTVGYNGMAGTIRAVVTVSASTTGGVFTVLATLGNEKQVGGSSIIS